MPRPTKSQELLEFEIGFYERLVATHPEFPDALVALAEAYSRRGWHEKGLELDRRLVELKPQDAIAWYNLACSYALLKRFDEAVQALEKALGLGYEDFAYLLRDPDLAGLRQSPKLRRLLEQRLPLQKSP